MDFHILIVITCVFLASLLSLLFINKFFRRKTFEEIIAEKKAMTERIYGPHKVAAKKPRKLVLKKEKKQRHPKEQPKETTEHEDSDEQPSMEDEAGPGLSKVHVEFEPDPVVVTYSPAEHLHPVRRVSISEKESVVINNATKPQKSKKEKKAAAAKGGILINKNEPVTIKDNSFVDEQLNTFDVKLPKDVVELKKQEKDRKEEKQQNNKDKKNNKKEKAAPVEKPTPAPVPESVIETLHVAKELKQQEEKVRQGSPKNQQNNSNKSKQQNKKQNKEAAAPKEITLEKLSDTDNVGVSLLMNLFRHAELNRSEIQILIDYLLNKQQDMPSTHSEWSDDIVQKLKRQLEEKERLLAEEQEASMGLQAKLRELRSEINTERGQMHASFKAYIEKIQGKEQEIAALNQELQAMNEKFALERQQFKAKLLREKQAGNQDLLSQLQIIQNEMAHKDKVIAELTCMVNASHQVVEESQQKNEIIQQQVQQIRALEQQREELEQISNSRVFELENTKTLETENAESKVEIRNLQNALESLKADLSQSAKDVEAVQDELAHTRNVELIEKQKHIQMLQAKNDELTQQLVGISSKTQEQSKEQTGLQASLEALKAQLSEKEKLVVEHTTRQDDLLKQLAGIEDNAQQQAQQQQELQGVVERLMADMETKKKQLQSVEQQATDFKTREVELLQRLQEQSEKNNELRMKNWKLIEALQNAEATVKQSKTLTSANANLVQQEQLLAATQKPTKSSATSTDPTRDQQHICELFQRLYPEAVAACASTALSASFEQWVEQVLATHEKQVASSNTSSSTQTNATSRSNKSTQSLNSASSDNHNTTPHNSHNNDSVGNSESTTNNSNSRISESNSSTSGGDDTAEVQKLYTQNAQLRAQIDELTKLVTKTSNTLSELEGRAREQDEHWRSLVASKDEQIHMLQHSPNGEQGI